MLEFLCARKHHQENPDQQRDAGKHLRKQSAALRVRMHSTAPGDFPDDVWGVSKGHESRSAPVTVCIKKRSNRAFGRNCPAEKKRGGPVLQRLLLTLQCLAAVGLQTSCLLPTASYPVDYNYPGRAKNTQPFFTLLSCNTYKLGLQVHAKCWQLPHILLQALHVEKTTSADVCPVSGPATPQEGIKIRTGAHKSVHPKLHAVL